MGLACWDTELCSSYETASWNARAWPERMAESRCRSLKTNAVYSLLFFFLQLPRICECCPSPSVFMGFCKINNFQCLKRHITRAIILLMMISLTGRVWNPSSQCITEREGQAHHCCHPLSRDTHPLKSKQLHFKRDLCIIKQHSVIKKNILCWSKDYEIPKRAVKHN